MKKTFLSIFLIAVTGWLLYATLVNKESHKTISIKAPLLKVHNQISFIDYIARWYEPFAGKDSADIKIQDRDKIVSDGTTLAIVKLNGLSSLFKITEGSHSKEVLFTASGDVETAIHTVTLSYKTTLWNEWFGNNNIISNAEKSLLGLKDFMEDTKRVYGFNIGVTLVTDTTFLFTQQIVANSNKKDALKNLYESLIQYAKEKSAGYNGTKILYLAAAGKDSIHLYTSIGITNNIEKIPLTGPFALRRMPYQKNLIIADYEGSFGKINELFTAMEQYRTDNSMTSMAIPFIKFTNDSISFDDNETIKVKGFFPVL
jgi:hypothetical protein